MITTRLLRAVKDAGVGLNPFEINEWAEALSLAIGAGTLRLGDYNAKLINSISLAWCSKTFMALPAHEYTHGERPIQWLDANVFASKASAAQYYIRLPIGHPVRADYVDGQLLSVNALQSPGDYSIDVTDALAPVFPAGIDAKITAVYAVVSVSETNWSREALRVGTLIAGERGFIEGIDQLTLSWVDGCDIQNFADFGVLGALSVPLIDFSNGTDNTVDKWDNSRCVLIAVSKDWRCALYCSRVQTGEIMSIRTISGAGGTDLACLELDTGISVSVPDLLALRNRSEGSEVFCACEDDSYLLSDEYGNYLLGSRTDIFD